MLSLGGEGAQPRGFGSGGDGLDLPPTNPGRAEPGDHADVADIRDRRLRAELQGFQVGGPALEGVQKVELVGRGANPNLMAGLPRGGLGGQQPDEPDR